MKYAMREISLKRLVANPDNPNEMSKTNFLKLARNIGQTEMYEPLVVRPYKMKKGYFQLINGYHRARVLMKIGYLTADCAVWDCDDVQTGVLLMTLNRLGGKDVLNRRVGLLKYLSAEIKPKMLAKILLQTETQINKLMNLKMKAGKANGKCFLNTLVFFVNEVQKEKIEKALSSLSEQVKDEKTKAAKRAAALTVLAEFYLDRIKK
jgi:ParB-like chromosome segregation protein Spo0J